MPNYLLNSEQIRITVNEKPDSQKYTQHIHAALFQDFTPIFQGCELRAQPEINHALAGLLGALHGLIAGGLATGEITVTLRRDFEIAGEIIVYEEEMTDVIRSAAALCLQSAYTLSKYLPSDYPGQKVTAKYNIDWDEAL